MTVRIAGLDIVSDREGKCADVVGDDTESDV